jgi:regulator of protease activity HflC (stomatin/prohibitin superfamily)
MEKQMRAERARRAVVLEAEGEKRSKILEAEGMKESEVNRAEGDKQAKVLRAEGEAEALMRMAQAEAEAVKRIQEVMGGNEGGSTNYLVAMRYIDALKTMTSGENAKTVYLPYEATGVLGALGGMKELFGKPTE